MVRFSIPRRRRKASKKFRKSKTKRVGKKTSYKGSGYIKVARMTKPFVIKNTAVAGSVELKGYSGVSVNAPIILGAPEQDTNYSQNVWNIPFAATFTLQDIAGASEFTGLFDQYRIAGVMLKFKYNSNTWDGSNTSGRAQNQPVIKYDYDYDDKTLPIVNTFIERMGVKSKLLNDQRFVKIFVKPRILGVTADATTLVATTSSTLRAPWLDTSNDSIQHLGLKGYIEGMPLGSTTALSSVIQCECTYYLEFKDIQ